MIRAIVVLAVLSGCAGHAPNIEPVGASLPSRPMTYQPSFPQDVAFISDRSPITLSSPDGNWYCLTVSGEKVTESTPREGCYRTLSRCNAAREFLAGEGYDASDCKAHKEAYCLLVYLPDLKKWREICYITGKECDRAQSIHKKAGYEVKPCTVQKNDKPPSGGKSSAGPLP